MPPLSAPARVHRVVLVYALLDAAETQADEMAELLATANGDRAEQNESKIIRDKAYTHLKGT